MLHYELYKPGDGHEYPFVWLPANEIEGFEESKGIYLTVMNGRFGSMIIDENHTPIDIATQMQSSVEQALVFKLFCQMKREKTNEIL